MTILGGRCLPCLLLLLSIVSSNVGPNPGANMGEDGPRDSHFLFVGTYTVGTHAERESKGIYAYRFDPISSRLTALGLAAETTNPSFLAIDPSGRFMYAVNEIGNYKGGSGGAVSAFAIDRDSRGRLTGKLSLLNVVASGGADPCYIALDKTGKYVLVANYTGGSVAAFPVQSGGRIGESSAFVQHRGSSVDRDRQGGPHAHWIQTTPDNRFAIVADLGLDELLIYRFDANNGSLTPNVPPFAKLDPGAGPRHLAFHPNGKFAYVINELQSSVTVFSYDSGRGELRKKGSISTLAKDYSGSNTAAEIKVHPNGKFLFASNRGEDSIAVFSLDGQTGALTLVDRVSTQGKTPRNFEIDPTGRFLLVANQESNDVVVFRIDLSSGRLKPTGATINVGAPVCLEFLTR